MNFLSSDNQTCVQLCGVDEFYDSNNRCFLCNSACLEFAGKLDANVTENLSIGSIVYTVNVTDKRDLERIFEYAIVSGNAENKFSINSSTGVVHLIDSLDYEQTTSYSLGVVVADITSDPTSFESATATIDIIVIDFNDNPPMFLQPSYLVQIDEDINVGSTIVQVEANDIDSNNNALPFHFSILDSTNLFGIESNSGEIFIISKLDYEQQTEHVLSIEAIDSGVPSLSATVIVTVKLNDVNDERPFFIESLYSLTVSEAVSVDTIVLTVNASDPDTLSLELTYELIGTASFTIDSTGIIYTAHELDYEMVSLYSFDVVVSDGVLNTNPLGTSTVVIMVTDVNDNPPMFLFSDETISISVFEDVTIDSIVLNASATDLDTDMNGLVSYSIDQSGNVFSITNDGLLKLDTSLDRESISFYTLTITAMDSGILQQLSSNVTVEVLVADVNDNVPQFNNTESTFVISENQPLNSVVVMVKAFDVDIGINAVLQYSILIPVDSDIPFSINSNTGVLSVSNSLDYELNTSYSLVIQVEDNGEPSLSNTTVLLVELLDENDNSPVFTEGIYNATIPENVSIGANVIQLSSVDKDSGVNSYTEYFIQSGNQNKQFSLNSTTGEVYVSDVLDYEEQSEYELVILANNTLSNKPLTSTVHFIITINDINEFHPEFDQDLFVFSVLEEQLIGTFINFVPAKDNDTGQAGESLYTISPSSDPFEIINDFELVTTSVLDRESVNLYTLTVTAVNVEYPFFSTVATIIVNVEDINDNAPIFLSSSYKAFIPENSPAGYLVSLLPPLAVQDFDAFGPNSEINYSINMSSSLLTIDQLTGVILLLTGDIDYEDTTSFEFSILASDNGQPSLISEVTVEVDVTNQNDISPALTSLETTVTFIEETDTVSLAPSVNITDEDDLPIQSISVRLLDVNEAPSILPDVLLFPDPTVSLVSMNNDRTLIVLGPFTVSVATDILRSVKFVNTEAEPNPSSRYFQVSVFDGVHTVTSSLTEVKIQLINDNTPFLSLNTNNNVTGNYETVFIEDGLPVSIASTNISLEDKDEAELATFKLVVDLLVAPDLAAETLQISQTVTNSFQITYTSFNQSLDVMGTNSYENWENLIKGISYYNSDDDPSVDQERLIRLILSDAANNSVTVNTTITVVAVNDPPFLNLGDNLNFEATFVEGRGEVALTSQSNYQLTDSDSDNLFNASIILFNPQDGDSERIDIVASNIDGVLIEKTSYSITISGVANVSVYSQLLSETTYYNDKEIPSPIIRNVLFTVGDGELESTAMTYVSFSSINDPPIVDLNGEDIGVNYTAVFVEDGSPIPAFASTLAVSDVDSDSLSYAIVTLTPTPVSTMEGISLVSSTLLVTGNASYVTISGPASPQEIQDSLRNIYYYNDDKEPTGQQRTITVIVSDGETLSEEVYSYILVLLQNDIPVVSLGLSYVEYEEESDTVSLVERATIIDDDNTTMHSVIVTITGIADGNLEVFQYSLPTDQVEVVSNINTNTYEYAFTSIVSSGYEDFTDLLASIGYKHLSLEPTPGIRTVSIVVSDGLDSSDPYTVAINVTLINDNTPLVNNPIIQQTVIENIINVPVHTVTAEDVDSSTGPFASHGQIVYSIVGGNIDNVFVLNSATGVLTIVKPVDREVSPILPLLTISVTNPVPLDNDDSYPNVILLISVQDQNDVSPQWENTVYNFEIVENSQIGSIVGSVIAFDNDIGSNGDVSYSILTPDSGFTIDETSGVITVLEPTKVDREITPLITFTVEAVDGGSPPLLNTTNVYIRVLDENDNVPSLSAMFQVQVEEDIDIGETFYTIVAEDPDNGTNGSLIYSVLDDNSLFDINETSGGIYSLVQLDRETNETLTFEVLVSDQGSDSDSLSAVTTVIVTILDVNDNSPVFLESQYSGSIFENEPSGQFVTVVSATDSDKGNNSKIEYSLSSNASGLFVIHPITGEIESVVELDAEMMEVISFEVFASDPSFTATAAVVIYIEDFNDNIPVFSLDTYTASVYEDVSIPFSLLNISATDMDITESNITYSIQPSDYSTYFDIDLYSGNLLIVEILDREVIDNISLLVEASDNGVMPMMTIASVFITVLDVNDNPPVFDSLTYNFTVVENSEPNSLGTVNANDADALYNGEISYSILNDGTDTFEVNSTTGVIVAITQLDREIKKEYTFTILAQDGGSPSLNSTADVYIIVLDINDNTPEFQKEVYEVTLSEDYPLMVQFITIIANDSDSSDINSQIAYSISLQDNANYFHIDSISGAVTVITPLDAENSLLHIINVTATDTGVPALSSTVPVYIIVTDVNDNEIDVQLSSSLIEFVEEGDSIDVFPNVIITDNDVDSIVVNATVSIVNCSYEECLSEKLTFNGDIDSIIGGSLVYNNFQTELSFTGNFTSEQITSLLRNISYKNTLAEFVSVIQYIDLTISDGLYITEQSVRIDLVRVNDHAPVIDLYSSDGGDSLGYSTQFTEGGEGSPVALNVSITDGDSGPSLLDTIKVTILNHFDDPHEILAVDSNSDISVFPSVGGPSITLIGPADISAFESLLSNVLYFNYEDNPTDIIARTIEVIADDGTHTSNPSYTIITIQTVNDPPILLLSTNINSTVTYIEDSPSVLVAPNAQLSDPDSFSLKQISFRLFQQIDNGFEYLVLSDTNGLTISENTPTSLVLSGTKTVLSYLSIIKSIKYINNASEPTEGERLVSIIVSDGEATTEAFVFLNITLRNDPPVISITTESVSFIENGPAIAVFPDAIQITDSDSAILSSVFVEIVNPVDQSNEYLFWNGTLNLTVNENMTSALVLQGNSSTELFENALSSIYYRNEAENPSSVERQVKVIASDGNLNSTPVYIIVNIALLNSPPEIVLDSFGNNIINIFYTEEIGIISVIDTTALVTDEDDDLLSHMLVTLSPILDNEQESIVFSNISNSVIVQSSFNESSSLLSYTLSFSFSAPIIMFNQLLRSLKYENTADEPDDSLSRELVITVNDNTEYSNPATVIINITLLNDNQPEFLNMSYNFSVSENVQLGSSVGKIEAVDLDKGDEFYYVLLSEDVPFIVDELSGEVTTTGELDREETSEYELKLGLSISLDPISLFNSEAKVYVTIEDVNEPPFFNQSKYVFTVLENATVGTEIGTVIAEDFDSNENGLLNFTVFSEFIAVDINTGILFTSSLLDRETTPTITVTVVATDSGIESLSTEAEVQIFVSDVNDNSPVFSQSQYSVQLIENIAVSSVIQIVTANDVDFGINAEISYSILNGDSIPFEINETAGIISTTETLIPANYTITVIATDKGNPQLSGTTLLLIDVHSIDAGLPMFSQQVYEASIFENSNIETYLLTVSAMDSIFNSSLTYSVDTETFFINSTSGEVFSSVKLDRENQSLYTFIVVATSSDNRQGSAELVVTVIDVNDFPPVFSSKTYNFSVLEGSKFGDIVGYISAVDSFDTNENAIITNYDIESNSFSIDNNGTIFVLSELDRETQAEYVFNAYANDSGNPSLSGVTLVSIVIQDINDNPPNFTEVVYEGSAIEENELPLFVLNVTAYDVDIGQNAQVLYSITSPFFTINSITGEIYTNIALDYEQQVLHSFTVYATDNGNPSLNSSTNVQVTVINIDDTPPVFSQTEYMINMTEEEPPLTHIIQLMAYETDNNDSAIVYGIVENSDSFHFDIDSDTGDLFVAVTLDREVSTSFSVTVSATSSNVAISSTATVTIMLTDINDNPPDFVNEPISFSVLENATNGTIVGTVQVSDKDEGTNAVIEGFSLLNGTDAFSIDPSTGVVTTSGTNIDREMNELVSLFVSVHDMGSPELTSSTIVVIIIGDINDNLPVFEKNYTISVQESTVPNTPLITLNATDEDQNSVTEYTLLNNDSSFILNLTSGQLSLAEQLDYETQMTYELVVLARDKLMPSFSDTATVTVNVLDVDDIPPYFESPSYFTSVIESSEIGTPFLTVFAKDDDTVHLVPIVYSILEDNVPFSITTLTGQLSVKNLLDRELQDSYIITVQAQGFPNPPATAVVTIEVTDVNDFVPTFTNETYIFTVSELSSINTSIGEISVFDNDLTENGEIISVLIHPLTSVFTLDNASLSIYLNSELDYEQITDYVFNVTAIDGGTPSLTGTTTVRISVLDENDNTPIIQTNTTVLYIFEGTNVQTIIATIEAIDLDAGINGMIEFSVLNNGQLPVSINQSSGELYVTNSLFPGNYSIIVTASDLGTPTRSSSLTLTIIINDVNQMPSFTSDVYNVTVSESVDIGTEIITVMATDADEGISGIVRYNLSNSDNYFDINETSGEVSVLAELDRETQDYFEMTVIALDEGEPALSATALLQVTVSDVNDNQPLFSQPEGYFVNVSENAAVGEPIATITATDDDIGVNSQIVYVLSFPNMSPSGVVSVGSSTGTITVKKSLDREMFDSFVVTLIAFDGGNPSLSQNVPVNITILDADDNPPIFSTSLYTSIVLENITVGTDLLNVSAKDIDMGENGIVRYQIHSDSAVPFSINSETGSINVTNPGLDRETNSSFLLTLEAFNPFSSIHTATAMLSIEVQDINDNYPLFIPSNVFSFEVNEASSVSSVVGTILATDNDEGSNAEVMYYFVPSNEMQYLNVDSVNGEVYLVNQFDYEDGNEYSFQIVVEDNGVLPLSSTGTVIINVINTNDVAPLVSSLVSYFTYTEQSSPINIGNGINVNDSDNLVIDTATVELTLEDATPVSDQDFITLQGLSSPLLTLQSNGHIINITGPASAEVFTEALQLIQYGSASDEPSIINRIISIQVDDGVFTSNKIDVIVEIETINDHVPSIDFSPNTPDNDVSISYKEDEDDILLIVPQDTLIVDGDSGVNMIVNGSALLLESSGDMNELLSATSTSNVIVTLLSSFEVMFTGEAALNQFLVALKTLSYTTTDNNRFNTTTTRLVEVVISDGIFVSTPSYISITVFPSNDPPTLSVQDFILDYTEDDASIPVFGDDLNIEDVDSSTLTYINIQILDQIPDIEFLTYSIEDTNITVQFIDGSLRFVGSASIEDYTIVLLSLNYTNTAINSSLADSFTGSKRIQVTLFDGIDLSDVYEIIITFSSINDPPIVDLNGQELPGLDNIVTYYEEGEPVLISSQAVIFDIDSTMINSALIEISNRLDNDDEVLFVSINTTLESNYNISNGKLSVIGNATIDAYQQLLQSVSYDNTNSDPTIEDRIVSVTVSDDTLSTSSLVYTTIQVMDVNDPPILTITGANNSFIEGGSAVGLFNTVEIFDVDNTNFKFVYLNILNAEDIEFEGINGYDGFSNLELTAVTTINGNIIQYSFELIDGAGANYQTLLLSLTYFNTALEPSNSTRIIEISIDDGEDTSQYVEVEIPVVLINDNPPFFISDDSVPVLESIDSGSIIYTAVASDIDVNSLIHYSISEEDDSFPFYINATNGDIIVTEILDRETVSSYIISIIANDTLHIAKLLLSVIVEDVNDNLPVFDQDYYEVVVFEDEIVNSLILLVNTTDADAGTNAQVQYQLVQPQDNFVINRTTGVLILNKPLDYESQILHNLTVIATDYGTPNPLSSTTYILVNIDNVNDNPPLFESIDELIDISENTLISTLVVTVSAIDPDGYNISYALIEGQDLFNISDISGDVYLIDELDRESSTNHTLTIVAVDSQSPVQSSTLQLNIIVKDIDDNPPIFVENLYDIQVTENTNISTSLLTLEWDDSDEGLNAEGTLAISSGNEDNLFLVNSDGDLLVSGLIDREQQSSYSLTVTVSGNLNPNLNDSLTVNITILDENDFAPTFEDALKFTLFENVSIGSIVGNVNAIDNDTGTNALITYSFVGNQSGDFVLETDGTLRVNQMLDLEQLSSSIYSLNVIAVDGGEPQLTGSVLVSIEIKDINEFSPVFTSTKTEFVLLENSPVDTIITIITAEDGDFDEEANEINYSIEDNDVGFAINALTGELFTNRIFDYENNETAFDVTLLATDNGIPRLSSSLMITVYVEDVNEFAPVFTNKAYFVSISENTSIDSTVLLVHANDKDGGDAGIVSYRLLGDMFPFNVTDEGYITLQEDLDREYIDIYNFSVESLNPFSDIELSSIVPVSIIVTDINDNPPVIQLDSFSVIISSTVGINSSVYEIEATDADIGDNAVVRYSIVDQSGIFTVEETKGIVRVTSDPLPEGIFTIQIIAENIVVPAQNDSIMISITVIASYSLEFSNEGPGFFTNSQSSTSATMDMFINEPYGRTGRMSAELAGASVLEEFNVERPPAVSVDGMLTVYKINFVVNCSLNSFYCFRLKFTMLLFLC